MATSPAASAAPGQRRPVLPAGLLAGFLLVALTHLGCLLAGADRAADVTQVLAMPVLAAALAAATSTVGPRARLVRWTLAALAGSWLGDTVPRFLAGDAAFLAMVGGFLLAQLAYLAAFAPSVRGSVAFRRRPWLIGYAAAFVALAVCCLPGAGALAPAVLVYGVTLVSMAVLATGVHRLTWIGGALFLFSDGMIAMDAFAPGWPLPQTVQQIAVMSTYLAAQMLLVLGTLARSGLTLRAVLLPGVGTGTPRRRPPTARSR